MNNIPDELVMEVMKFCKIKNFINLSLLNKDYLKLCQDYLRVKKNIFELENREKTYKNCLYKFKKYKIGRKPTEQEELWDINREHKRYGFTEYIIRIVKVEPFSRNANKLKITYWVISNMGSTGKCLCVYPDWAAVHNLKEENFIPFY